MKRTGGLWPDLSSWTNLHDCARRASAGKRSRPDVAQFLLNLENEVTVLQRELIERRYRPGPYREFLVQDGKPRLISAAPFRDRVIHHALSGALEPLFERRFVPQSYACRNGKGTHAALRAAREAARRYPFALSCDVRKYFASIDYEILLHQLERVVKCQTTLDLARTVVEASNAQEPCNWYFPGDNLFTPFERRRGLPLGNQTSQFFANLYLNPMDHFVLREIRPGAYMRYVDDLLLFGDDRQELERAFVRMRDFAAEFRLLFHERKGRVYRVSDGVTFLGWRIFPDNMRLVRENVVRFLRRMKKMQRLFAEGRITRKQIKERVRAWIAHAIHGNTYKLREDLLPRIVFRKAEEPPAGTP